MLIFVLSTLTMDVLLHYKMFQQMLQKKYLAVYTKVLKITTLMLQKMMGPVRMKKILLDLG